MGFYTTDEMIDDYILLGLFSKEDEEWWENKKKGGGCGYLSNR